MHAKTISKYSKMKLPALLRKAQTVFNAWIRARDSIAGVYFNCISCGTPKKIQYYLNESGQVTGSNYHASHFYPVGSYTALRFDPDNCHGGCDSCNYHKHGNIGEYSRNLANRIGPERLEKLHQRAAMAKRQLKKWSRFELIDIIEKYK